MALRYFLACFLLSSLVAGQSPRYKLKGQKVSLKPDIPGRPDSILWKQNGNKVVEFNGQEQDEYGQYKNRVSLDWHTAELNITDLRFEDSGKYELEVYMNQKLSTSHDILEVIDRVAKPTISCEMNDGGGSNKSGMLLCSAEPRQPQSLMTFEWRSNVNVQPGTKLTIFLGDEYDDEVYSCMVSNPLSEETATFTAKDCYPENNSVLIGVLVTIAIVVLLLPVGLGIFYCKRHNKACFAEGNRKDTENPTQSGATQGSNENTADERGGHIDRTPTIPSTQRLIQDHDGDLQDEKTQKGSDENTADECQHLLARTPTNPSTQLPYQEHDGDVQDQWPKIGSVRKKVNDIESSHRGETLPSTLSAGAQRSKDKNKRTPLDVSRFANNNKGVADEDQLRESGETEDPQCENTPEPAVVLTNTISSTAAEQSESDKETAENDEPRSPLETTPTPPTTQPRNHVGDSDTVKDLEKNKDEETGSSPSTPDTDADRRSEPVEEVLTHREKENESEPADVSPNTMSDLGLSTASEHQDLEKDEDGKSPPANVVTPVPKPRLQLTQNSPNTAPEVTAGGQKEDANSDQVNGETDTSGVGETIDSSSSGEDERLSPVSEQRDSETTRHDQDPNLSQSETHTSEDNQQEMLNTPVPAAEKESGSEGNSEEPDLYSASSHQPQSSTPTQPDNRSNDTFQESHDAEHGEPSQQGEGKTTEESDESGESEDDTGEDKKLFPE